MSDVLIVHKEEHHHWSTCPCEACQEERSKHFTSSRLRHFTPQHAHALGFISSLTPGGSVASAERARQEAASAE